MSRNLKAGFWATFSVLMFVGYILASIFEINALLIAFGIVVGSLIIVGLWIAFFEVIRDCIEE